MAAFLALAEGLSPGAIDAVLPDKPDPRLPPLSIGLLRYGRRPEPEGMVKLWTWRKGAWRIGEPVEWADVRWKRLLDKDRVEVLS